MVRNLRAVTRFDREKQWVELDLDRSVVIKVFVILTAHECIIRYEV